MMIMRGILIVLTVFVGVTWSYAVPRNCRYNVYMKKDCPPTVPTLRRETQSNIGKCLETCDAWDKCTGVARDETRNYCLYKGPCNVRDLVKSVNMYYAKARGVYKVEPFANCPGNDISPGFPSLRASVCMERCDKITECVAFYRSPAGKCFLKSKCITRVNGKTYGDLFLGPLGQWQYIPNNYCNNPSVLNVNNYTATTCKQKCLRNKKCVAVTFIPKIGDCHLKYECTNIGKVEGTDIYRAPDCIDSLRADNGAVNECRSPLVQNERQWCTHPTCSNQQPERKCINRPDCVCPNGKVLLNNKCVRIKRCKRDTDEGV